MRKINHFKIEIIILDYQTKQEAYSTMDVECEDQIAEYYNIRKELESLGVQFRIYITKSEYLIPFLQPGRLMKVSHY